MAKGKNVNPADAYRKALRKKELKKNKAERAKARDFALVKKDTSELQDEIEKLEALAEPTAADKARLKQLKSELEKINKKKEEYVQEHPEQRKLVFRPRRFRNDGNKDGTSSKVAQDDEDSDDDIVMPEGPPPGVAQGQVIDSDEDIPMPEGPPPSKGPYSNSPFVPPPFSPHTLPVVPPYPIQAPLPPHGGPPPPHVSSSAVSPSTLPLTGLPFVPSSGELPPLPPPSDLSHFPSDGISPPPPAPGWLPPPPPVPPGGLPPPPPMPPGGLPPQPLLPLPPPPPLPPNGLPPPSLLLPGNFPQPPIGFPPGFPVVPPGFLPQHMPPPPPGFLPQYMPPPPPGFLPQLMPPPPPGFFPRRQSASAIQDPLSLTPHQTFQSRRAQTLMGAASLPMKPPATLALSEAQIAAATISAAPELRDLKKEATAFVPSALTRRKASTTKNSAPKLNSAPDMTGSGAPDRGAAGPPRPDIVSALKEQFGPVPLSNARSDGSISRGIKEKGDYEKFVEELADIL